MRHKITKNMIKKTKKQQKQDKILQKWDTKWQKNNEQSSILLYDQNNLSWSRNDFKFIVLLIYNLQLMSSLEFLHFEGRIGPSGGPLLAHGLHVGHPCSILIAAPWSQFVFSHLCSSPAPVKTQRSHNASRCSE